jgi:hypothetical protein
MLTGNCDNFRIRKESRYRLVFLSTFTDEKAKARCYMADVREVWDWVLFKLNP